MWMWMCSFDWGLVFFSFVIRVLVLCLDLVVFVGTSGLRWVGCIRVRLDILVRLEHLASRWISVFILWYTRMLNYTLWFLRSLCHLKGYAIGLII